MSEKSNNLSPLRKYNSSQDLYKTKSILSTTGHEKPSAFDAKPSGFMKQNPQSLKTLLQIPQHLKPQKTSIESKIEEMISSGIEGLSFTPELHSKIAMILKQVTENKVQFDQMIKMMPSLIEQETESNSWAKIYKMLISPFSNNFKKYVEQKLKEKRLQEINEASPVGAPPVQTFTHQKTFIQNKPQYHFFIRDMKHEKLSKGTTKKDIEKYNKILSEKDLLALVKLKNTNKLSFSFVEDILDKRKMHELRREIKQKDEEIYQRTMSAGKLNKKSEYLMNKAHKALIREARIKASYNVSAYDEHLENQDIVEEYDEISRDYFEQKRYYNKKVMPVGLNTLHDKLVKQAINYFHKKIHNEIQQEDGQKIEYTEIFNSQSPRKFKVERNKTAQSLKRTLSLKDHQAEAPNNKRLSQIAQISRNQNSLRTQKSHQTDFNFQSEQSQKPLTLKPTNMILPDINLNKGPKFLNKQMLKAATVSRTGRGQSVNKGNKTSRNADLLPLFQPPSIQVSAQVIAGPVMSSNQDGIIQSSQQNQILTENQELKDDLQHQNGGNMLTPQEIQSDKHIFGDQMDGYNEIYKAKVHKILKKRSESNKKKLRIKMLTHDQLLEKQLKTLIKNDAIRGYFVNYDEYNTVKTYRATFTKSDLIPSEQTQRHQKPKKLKNKDKILALFD
ncbi:UNKNOWN [Stylonychia lemnae]|uniref:Uncharacterized protein n=1 Tax=Stylonychia lemnae TaxID=5949 RepID=A0A077ZS80_STYLE|nr:UNKNOWN [Stylonychia lemnae]|eukprot:CDW72369.1 UNKNOWN [Stylonychia lemnae]